MHEWDDTTSVANPSEIKPPSESNRDTAYLIVLAGSNVGEMYKIDRRRVTMGRGGDADLRLLDDGISRVHAQIRVEGDDLFVDDLDSRNGTFCNGQKIRQQQLKDGDKIQLGRTTILKFTYHDRLDESFQQQMFDSALRDGLTKAYNKRYFMDRLESELRFSLRHRSSLSLLLIDLDHFKKVNDNYGHIVGDRVLADFSAYVHRSIRNEDVFARYGGEEFAIITRSIARQDARRFAERIRRGTEQLEIVHDGRRIPVTCSIGIATIPEDPAQTPLEMVKCADDALYQAKETGRNRVCETADLEPGTRPS